MAARRVYDWSGHAHFVTFSCYKRRRLLDSDGAKRIVLGVLGSQLAKQKGRCLGFAVMPAHVHAVVWFPESGHLSHLMKQWKQRSSVQIKKFTRTRLPAYASRIDLAQPVWQPRYYDFNIYSEKKLAEKLRYMHANPVRAGLVAAPREWAFSSARWYELGESVGLPIGRPE